jgi:hypothetical protein
MHALLNIFVVVLFNRARIGEGDGLSSVNVTASRVRAALAVPINDCPKCDNTQGFKNGDG